jgi:formylglycine-generating enzyme required for sulfatase activity
MSPKHRTLLLFVGMLVAGGGPAGAQTRGETFQDCPDCPEMVILPGGTFRMGSDTGPENERPAHEVTLAGFAVARTEVTRAQYAVFVKETGRGAPGPCFTDGNRDGRFQWEADKRWTDPGYPSGDAYPVTCMNWADAQDFVGWLAQKTGKPYRLLSEAEYEYALRGGTTTEYWWGDDKDAMCRYANGPDAHVMSLFANWRDGVACEDGHDFLAPVASYQPNGFGLYDMAGNAWEWTADCFVAGYLAQPRDGSAYDNGQQCGRRATRGGSFVYSIHDARSAQRNWGIAPYMRGGDVGFRVARDLAAEDTGG